MGDHRARGTWDVVGYPADEEGNTLVRFPQHPGVNTFGRDPEEAEEMAREALNAALEADFERGLKLPALRKPQTAEGERAVLVPLDAEIRMAFLLKPRGRRRTRLRGAGSRAARDHPTPARAPQLPALPLRAPPRRPALRQRPDAAAPHARHHQGPHAAASHRDDRRGPVPTSPASG
jgi:predicted RNase H-like HicB family nuclease